MTTKERYWVIGGEYECLSFQSVKNGAPIVQGPYDTRAQAREAWKRLSAEHSSRAAVRFGIAAEQIAIAQHA
jgi:hypothetical protein